MVKLNDFEVGQTAYVEMLGRARSKEFETKDCFFPCKVQKVGTKYVIAKNFMFEENEEFDGLVEDTYYEPDYVIFPTIEAVTESIRKLKAS